MQDERKTKQQLIAELNQLRHDVRRQAEQMEQRAAELESERQRTQAILDSAGEGILLLNTEQEIQYLNPAVERLTGQKAAEMLGHELRIWISGLTPHSVMTDLDNHIRRGEVWQGEVINRRKDGSVYDVALTINPLKDTEGRVVAYVAIQHDITHLKELDRLKDQFVTRIGHELRTPVANVKLYLGLLEHGKPEKHEQYLQTLRRETERLQKLVNGFLEISEWDTSTEPVHLMIVDLNPLLADLWADRTALAAERGLSLETNIDPALPPALANQALVLHIASNLIANALDYTPRGGRLTLSTAARSKLDRSWVTFCVQDSGPGIAPAEALHLFERFYRGKAADSFAVPGAGLGLAISKVIVEKLGGFITVESPSAIGGGGAAFIVWLKMASLDIG